jgi:hypothetical protein
MRIFRLTPEDAEAAGRALARALDWFRQLREQLHAIALRLQETVRSVIRFAEQARPVLVRPDRPAWASPYGPAPRRR